MINFTEFFEERQENKQRRYKFVVEAFDPKVADKKGIEYTTANVGGVDVVIPNKRKSTKDGGSTIIINQSDLMDADSSFCMYNPKINDFASQSPENLFFVLSLVVGTIGTSWPSFRNLFPVYVAFVKETDGKDIPVEYIIGLDGEKHPVKRWFYRGASKYIKGIWHQRNELYDNIYGKGLIENEFNLYKYLIKNISGVSTVKAAFSVQLLSGKLGCIDNINADIYGLPVSITNNVGKQIQSPGFSKGKEAESDKLTPGGEKIIRDYIDFVEAIGDVSNSPYSQRLWDDWVQLAAAKAVFMDHDQIQFNMVDGRVAVMPTYNNATNSDPKYTQFLKNVRKQGIDPYGGYEIGKEHYTLPKMGGDIDDAKSRVS